jgi:hypothetical protein
MFAGHGKFTDSAWGDPEAAPEPARPPISVDLAVKADTVIKSMDKEDIRILKNEFVVRHIRFNRYSAETYTELLQTAINEFWEKYEQPVTGKPRVLQMLQDGWKTKDIAFVAKVTRQYVWQVKTGRS